MSPVVVALDGTCGLGREALGGKAWSLNRMRALGLPVPPAFAVTTGAGEVAWDEVVAGVRRLEAETGRSFGAGPRPLLVSVRSGAATSMPGMMDTVLDLGFDDEVEAALAAGDPAWAADTGDRFRAHYRQVVAPGKPPADAWEQLRAAVTAVRASWWSTRAVAYRAHHGLSDAGGTAVTVQAMVFGNLDDRSGAGVLFTRDCRTGERVVWAEWLPRAQGEDVVGGERDPLPLSDLLARLPDVHARLLDVAGRLEADARDVQDVEFTVEAGALYVLQSRTAARAPRAAVRCAIAMADEGLVTRAEALARVRPEHVVPLLAGAVGVVAPPGASPVARGLAACPGVARGRVVAEVAEAEERAAAGESVVLARPSTSPEDVRGFLVSSAVLTETGGVTSHAAVVGRELGRPTVVGCGSGSLGPLVGRDVTVDGTTGLVWDDAMTTSLPDAALADDVRRLAGWAAEELGAAPCLEPAAGAGDLPQLLAELAARGAADRRGSQGQAPVEPFSLLRLVALKGRVGVEPLSQSLGRPGAEVEPALAELASREYVVVSPIGVARTTAGGREALAALLAKERDGCDPEVAAALYDRFCALNDEVKAVVTRWQVRGDGSLNDHADATYDAAVLASLAAVGERATPLLVDVGALAPRLARYLPRLRGALERVQAGDTSYVGRLVVDSFHTVWFELHEDLMSVAGLSRAAESAAGRAL